MKNKNINAPRILEWILNRISDPVVRNSIAGDFAEIYREIVIKRGVFIAKTWYWCHFFVSLPSFFKWIIFGKFTLYKSYFKIAIRNLFRHKGYSFINISGLTISIACSILIFLWIFDELSYDRFHENSKNICRVISEVHNGDKVALVAATPAPLGKALQNEYPEILNSTRFQVQNGGWAIKYGNNFFKNDMILMVTPSFFDLFNFPFLGGDQNTALSDRYSVVITEKMSQKYFGLKDPIGKILEIDGKDFKVTGILKNIPHLSHLKFDFIIPLKSREENRLYLNDWSRTPYKTYLLLNKNSSLIELSLKITNTIKKHLNESNVKLLLQPLTKIHLYSADFVYDNTNKGKSDIKTIYLFSTIAFLLILIACINSVNITTARSGTRSKEIGLRKVVGAQRKDISRQFFIESVLLTFLAFMSAIFLVLLLLPAFNELSGKPLNLDFFSNIYLILGLICIAFITGMISGIYPALFLSSFKPLSILKGSLTNLNSGRVAFRKILVLIQFSLSILLIIGSMIISQQINYIQSKELGYDKNHLLMFVARGVSDSKIENVKNILLKNPNILGVAKGPSPLLSRYQTIDVDWEGKDKNLKIPMKSLDVGYDYIEVFRMKILQGRNFSKKFPSDQSSAYILNEEAVKAMGIRSPLGKKFSFEGQQGIIIGVVQDFHSGSLYEKIEPLVLHLGSGRSRLCVRLRAGIKNLSKTVNNIKTIWGKNIPEYPFSYWFFDESINNLYKKEILFKRILKYFTFLAIFISCLGLFGLTAFAAEQRTKEIGIRKVLGASVSGIIRLISKEFIILVVVANVIAWPISYIVMNSWLRHFAYRIDINPWWFVFSGILVLVIALITTGYQSIKAATAKSVDILRYE